VSGERAGQAACGLCQGFGRSIAGFAEGTRVAMIAVTTVWRFGSVEGSGFRWLQISGRHRYLGG
jgi:hypothetical protein